jgi:hypothetical protein
MAKNLKPKGGGFKVSKPNILNYRKIVNKANLYMHWKKRKEKKIAKQITAKKKINNNNTIFL